MTPGRPLRSAALGVGVALVGLQSGVAGSELASPLGPGLPWLEDEERFGRPLPPPPALPQQLNGVIRARSEGDGAPAERLERIRDVFLAMRRCWRVPRPPGGPTGQQLTLRLSFKRNGEVLGEPRITFYQAGGDREAQESFRRSILQALQRCTPLPFSASLGSAIAGRPFTFRFVDDRAL